MKLNTASSKPTSTVVVDSELLVSPRQSSIYELLLQLHRHCYVNINHMTDSQPDSRTAGRTFSDTDFLTESMSLIFRHSAGY
jgi:hypothetical protein